MAHAAQRQFDLCMVTAWHTAIFALNGYAGKLKGKSLADYLGDKPKTDSPALQRARGIAFFQRLKAEGVPVEISRVH